MLVYHHFFRLEGLDTQEANAKKVSDVEQAYDLPAVSELIYKSSGTAVDFVPVVRMAKPAIVSVKAIKVKESKFFREEYSKSNGSGVIISPDGYIITSYHVIEGARDIEIKMEDRRQFNCSLVGYDLATDIALLKIEADNLAYITFGDSDSLHVGEWVLAIGNPFKLQSSVTAGIVSAKARSINIFDRRGIESFIQTDAAINQGNSGGALLNTKGELIGINTAIVTYSGNYEGFSFSVPGNLVKKVIDDIRQYGAVQRAWLSVSIFDVDEKISRDLDLDFIGGVYLDAIDKDGAAYEAGLQSKDVIVSIDGVNTPGTPEFLEILGRYSPGDQINIRYYRDGKLQATQAILKNQLNTTDFVAVRKDRILTDLGFELRDLDSKEKERLVKEGIRVVSIYNDSKIARTNMDPGYIITTVNGKKVSEVDELIRILRKSSGKVYINGFYENYSGEWPYTFSL